MGGMEFMNNENYTFPEWCYHMFTWLVFSFLTVIGSIISLVFLISSITEMNPYYLINSISLILSIYLMFIAFKWVYLSKPLKRKEN